MDDLNTLDRQQTAKPFDAAYSSADRSNDNLFLQDSLFLTTDLLRGLIDQPDLEAESLIELIRDTYADRIISLFGVQVSPMAVLRSLEAKRLIMPSAGLCDDLRGWNVTPVGATFLAIYDSFPSTESVIGDGGSSNAQAYFGFESLVQSDGLANFSTVEIEASVSTLRSMGLISTRGSATNAYALSDSPLRALQQDRGGTGSPISGGLKPSGGPDGGTEV